MPAFYEVSRDGPARNLVFYGASRDGPARNLVFYGASRDGPARNLVFYGASRRRLAGSRDPVRLRGRRRGHWVASRKGGSSKGAAPEEFAPLLVSEQGVF
jgi:hypothetical protein